MVKRTSGTKEWSSVSVNCVTGCTHGCRYCYAKSMALRFGTINTEEEWNTPHVRIHDVEKKRKKYNGVVMFPTTHDITPETIDPCISVLTKLLKAGNDVLIVSKPHLDCITRLCQEFVDFRHLILFRFSITAMDDDILSYWEPGAPSFNERLECLKLAYESGFRTSVSCEPMLDSPNIVGLYDTLEPFVTDSIWVGKMNEMGKRVKGGDERRIAAIVDGQTDKRIMEIYQELKDRKLVRWKDSIREVVTAYSPFVRSSDWVQGLLARPARSALGRPIRPSSGPAFRSLAPPSRREIPLTLPSVLIHFALP